MPKKLSMAGWYDPSLLVQTGIRVAVSTVFGQFADKREAIAAANAIEPLPADPEFDYGSGPAGKDFWLDYLADTGDGWNSTFAMARLVTEPSLTAAGADATLPRGRLLVLGGDQVYPTAARDEYRDRFLGPFEAAHQRLAAPAALGKTDLYAVPGNHDWYDGLNAFFGLFCRRRVARPGELGISRPGREIAGRQTKQTRSYFAIRLPGKWWLWGTDSQLEGYIDQPQIDYFQHAASNWMEPGSKLILCVPDPSWVYVDPAQPEKKFASFCYLERLAGMALNPEDRSPMNHELKLVLTGDSHHYARYVEMAPGENDVVSRHYFVCGGGGAFLHPTHQLENKQFNSRFPTPGVDGPEGEYPRNFQIASKADGEAALYPDQKTSARLAFRNLGFAWFNWKFALVLSTAYLVFNWILNFNAKETAMRNLAGAFGGGDIGSAVLNYILLIFVSPWAFILMGVALGGYYYFADSPNSGVRRFAIGLAHATAHAIVVTATTIAVVSLLAPYWDGGVQSALILMAASLASGVLSATAFGIYLLICLNGFGLHANEGFSSLRIANYKSFLRLRISPDGVLTVFPIGLERVPDERGGDTDDPAGRIHLIEAPIQVGP